MHILIVNFSLSSMGEEDYRNQAETIAPAFAGLPGLVSKTGERRRMAVREVDEQRAEAFAERLVGMLNEGSLALMMSIGHRTGLFDVMAGLPPSTSEEISSSTNLNERYVREWLGAMVVGGIVEHDPEGGTYRLPPEHAASLTRDAAPTTSPPSCSTSGFWARWRISSSRASNTAAACRTRPSRVSRRSWPKTAARRSFRRCSTTSCRSSRGLPNASKRASRSWMSDAAADGR